MNTIQAMKILDRVREGASYSEATITKALFIVGEIDEHEFGKMESGMRSPGMGSALQKTGIGIWSKGGPGLVGERLCGH